MPRELDGDRRVEAILHAIRGIAPADDLRALEVLWSGFRGDPRLAVTPGGKWLLERQWRIRPYREGDEMQIFELWKAALPAKYDRTQWLAWWRWSHLGNPAGIGEADVAEADGKIVGHNRLMFLHVKIRDRLVKAYQGCDLITHPDYRGQGIGVELTKHMLHRGDKAGAAFGYTFPTSASYRMVDRYFSSWYDLGGVHWYLRPTRWKPFTKWAAGNGILSAARTIPAVGARLALNEISRRTRKPPQVPFVVNQVDRFDDRMNLLWREVCDTHGVMVVRSHQYLNWRYDPPGKVYRLFIAQKSDEIKGYAVLQDRTERGIAVTYIADMVTGCAEVADCLVSRIVEDCTLRNVDLLLYPIIGSRTCQTILGRNGFTSLPFLGTRLWGKRVFVFLHSSAPRKILAERGNWFVQIGDSDFGELWSASGPHSSEASGDLGDQK